jgi:hypothetical protein
VYIWPHCSLLGKYHLLLYYFRQKMFEFESQETDQGLSSYIPQTAGNLIRLCHYDTLHWNQGSNCIAAIAAIAVEGEQNAVDHCGNDGNFLPYSAIFILFTVHYYFGTWIQMLIKSCVNHYFCLSFLRTKNTKEIRRHVSSLSKIQSNNKIKVLLQ